MSRVWYYLNVEHENHFLMNAPEVSEQQLSKHDRQDGDHAIECTTEINDSRARVEKDGADLFTPYWIYLQNSACHRNLSIIATAIPLFRRMKFPQARVCCGQNRQLFWGSTFFSPSIAPFCRIIGDVVLWSSKPTFFPRINHNSTSPFNVFFFFNLSSPSKTRK